MVEFLISALSQCIPKRPPFISTVELVMYALCVMGGLGGLLVVYFM